MAKPQKFKLKTNSPTITKPVKAGETIFKEGDHPSSMFLIKSGTVLIQKIRSEGVTNLARVFSGEVIGELAFFDRRPRSATAIAESDVELLEIQFDNLDKIYKEKVPDYLKTMIAAIAERLRKANELIRQLQRYAPADQRALSDVPATNLPEEEVLPVDAEDDQNPS